eukprot:scaffold50710_cov298-Isochrysis_galbana.AAC.2
MAPHPWQMCHSMSMLHTCVRACVSAQKHDGTRQYGSVRMQNAAPVYLARAQRSPQLVTAATPALA